MNNPYPRPRIHGLYAITPEDSLLPRLSARVCAVLDGGVRWVQFRHKTAPPPQKRALACELLRICKAVDARLIINDDPELALEIGADGVHLGADDGDIASARERLGPAKLIGASCANSVARARDAARAGADYVALGRFFPSRTKPDAPQASLDVLREVRGQLPDLPIVAIGGITLNNASTLLDAGADALACIDGLFEAADLQSRASQFLSLFPHHHSS
jgi:thiamine-phosphate pyrophosphorylase